MNASNRSGTDASVVLARRCSSRPAGNLVVALVVLVTTSAVLSACLSNLVATSEPFSERDLVGTWQAVYDTSMQFVTITSTETLTLKADGTYTQVFARGTAGMVDVVDGKRWYLDEANIIHLVGGMWPQLGPERSRMFAQGLIGGMYSIRNKELLLNAGEAYLVVSSIGNGRFTMHHVPTGPDGRDVIWFKRIEKSPEREQNEDTKAHLCGAGDVNVEMAASAACTSGSRVPQRPFETTAMLMDATLFPSRWRNRSIIPTADSHGAVEHVSRDMEGYGTIVHEVYRYKRLASARREYRRQLEVWYPGAQYYAQWEEKPDLRLQLDFADEAHVACASYHAPQARDAELCGMLARYGEFVVRFSAQIAPDAAPALDEAALAALLAKLDDRWENAMTLELPPP